MSSQQPRAILLIQPVTRHVLTGEPAAGHLLTDQSLGGQRLEDLPAFNEIGTDQEEENLSVLNEIGTDQGDEDLLVINDIGKNRPATNQPATNQPATNRPVTNQPVTCEPVICQTVVNQPLTCKPVTCQTVTDQTVTSQTLTCQPVATETAAGPDPLVYFRWVEHYIEPTDRLAQSLAPYHNDTAAVARFLKTKNISQIISVDENSSHWQKSFEDHGFIYVNLHLGIENASKIMFEKAWENFALYRQGTLVWGYGQAYIGTIISSLQVKATLDLRSKLAYAWDRNNYIGNGVDLGQDADILDEWKTSL
ncbi:hypothetical protein IF1G_06733 [Cordyceps javanica]|uniref:Uncharacterized protein n=1 Tax=Cordyceps javanica TaxID=43265 RepID=A0A545UZ16_9HYPO|nr:hypothetical protein IF1G_06733 [Cordyceps javanica]